jgi:16S rRNA (guanine966-N2)-methyltransferase
MTRIVGGAARGRLLAVPARGTRPTSDRAREALFNTLATMLDLDGVRVLDLFAGSGAVGLEALSRGAAAVTLVDSAAGAIEAIRRNAAAVALPGAEVVRRDVEAFLAAGNAGSDYDLAFADPPYALADEGLGAILTTLSGAGWLAADAVVVLERPAKTGVPAWPAGIEAVKERRYGAGVLWYGRRR